MRVSIIIPCFNAERYVAGAIQSALDQTHSDCEVIVIDDGSTDGSLDVIQSFGDKIRWASGPNRGGCAARNRGLALATGEWIQFLDADDYLLPDKIATQLATLAQAERSAEVDVIYSPVRIEYASRHAPTPTPPKLRLSEDPWVTHARWQSAQTGGILFRKTALLQVGAWNEQQPCCQDYEILFRLLVAQKRFINCPSSLAVYRRFETGTVSTSQPFRVIDEILKLLDLTENHLRQQQQLAPSRLNAINQHRFMLARNLWPSQPERARSILRHIHSLQSAFKPEPAPHAPRTYRAFYRMFGFAAAENIASWKRKITQRMHF